MNTEKYLEDVKAAADIRVEIDEDLHSRYKAMKGLFEEIFGLEGSAFKQAVDMVYYAGGYPSENSPAKIDVLVDNVLAIAKIFHATERLHILYKKFEDRGMKLILNEVILEKPVAFTTKQQVAWKFITAAEFPETNIALLKKIMDEALILQAEICEKADRIKITMAEKVEDEHQIRKPNFVKAVRFEALNMKKGEEEMKEKLQAFKDKNIHNMSAALEPLNETK